MKQTKKKKEKIDYPDGTQPKTLDVIQVINEAAYKGRVALKLTCKACGGEHIMQEDKKDPHTVKNCVEKWKVLSGFVVSNACNFCATDKTMTLTINGLNMSEFWQWVWTDVLKKVAMPIDDVIPNKLEEINHVLKIDKNVN